MSQLNAGDDVAHSVDVAHAGVQALVGQHEAAIHGDALLFVTHICSVGATANSNEHDVGLKYLTVCQGYLCTVSVLLNLLKESTSIELDAALLEGTLKNLDDGGIFVRNEVGADPR